MDLKLVGKNVVITGGSSGIGAAIVKGFLDENATVYFCGRNQEKIDSILKDLEGLPNVYATQLDVTDEMAFKAWIEEIGVVDVFIPNVSALANDWKKSVEMDLLTTIKNIETVIPKMTRGNPAVTFIGSVSATISESSNAYGSIKAALTHYIFSLSKDYAGKIRFNTVAPASTLFPGGGWDIFRTKSPKEFEAKKNQHPMKRLATPEEVAAAVIFISSTKATYISGETLHVDGGERTMVSF
ncbi:SDR family NAD(P)-dependent oxidoreductase [Vibrio sp. E150_011]